jgi:moderate conductance mechanosensitive channel
MDNATAAAPATLNGFQQLFSKVYTNFAVAIIILLAGVIIGRIAGRFVHKVLSEIELNNMIRKLTNVRLSMDEIIANFVTYFIYFIFIIMALDQLGVTTTVFKIISIVVILIIIASILLGVRDFIPNVISGIFLAQRRFLSKGDHVKVGDIEGEIIEINIVETRMKTKKGDMMYIPNSILTKKEVIKLRK